MFAFLINLDRSKDRLAYMQGQFARAGLEFERVSAVDGTDLPDALKAYFVADTRLSSGEIGCYASHLAVWMKIATGTHGEAVLVCEDDMILPQGFGGFLQKLLAVAPVGWDMIRLSPLTKRAIVPVCHIDQERWLVRYSR